MKAEIRIGDRLIGAAHTPLIVAEMSANHNQSLERALAIVEAAARAGADAVKIQTYTADSMTLNLPSQDFVISDAKNLWTGRSLYSLYQDAYTPWEWHKPIIDRCRELGMLCFSTPFDEKAVDFLDSLGVPCFKVASFENTYIPLIKKIAKSKKPLLISTGMATLGELDETVRTARSAGCDDLVLLKCTSTYPASPENAHLRTIPHMREMFGLQVGLSDHTLGCGAAVASVALGATVIEKHFTLRRADGGVDSAFSMEPEELRLLTSEVARAWQALGEISYGARGEEEKSKMFRRSIYVTEDVKTGEMFTANNLRCIRPGLGLETKHYESLLGKRAARDLTAGSPMRLWYVQFD